MKSKFNLLIALVLTVGMVVTALSGCGTDSGDGSSSVGGGDVEKDDENKGTETGKGDSDTPSGGSGNADKEESSDEENPSGGSTPSGGNDKPSDGGNTPSGGNDKPSGGEDKPGDNGDNPSDGDENQGSGTDNPPENEDIEQELPTGVATFDDLTLGEEIGKTNVTSSGVSFYYNQNSGAECKIVKHPSGEGYALRFAKTDTTKGDTLAFTVRNEGKTRFVAEFDIALECKNTTVPLQIDLGNAYRLQLSIDGNYVLVNDAKANGSAVYFLGGYRKVGDFIHIRVEYYYGDGTLDGQFAKIYFDGELFAISQNCYSATPSSNYSTLKFYSLIASDAVFYLDNVEAYSDGVTFVDDGDESTAYYYADESRDSEYNNRFLPAKAVLGSDVAKALESLCGLFDEGTYTWLANLYDAETGAFYYSNDARDYACFLPDIESTSQAMGLLNSMGLGTAQNMYTEEMAKRIVAWVQSLQSNDDGYFYHPQWGADVNSSRRGRDLSNSISVLNRFKAKPLYPTALDRLSGNASVSKNLTSPLGGSAVQAVSLVLQTATTSVNAHLASPEAFLAYLDGLFEKNTATDSEGNTVPNSYVIGHTVGSQASQIKAAGLADICINYFNERQNPENGLWESEENYRTASGLLKISSFYNSLAAEFPNPDKAVRSAINIASSEEPMTAIVYVYNPLSALSNILSNLKNYNSSEGSTELRLATIAEMQERALELISNTEEKLRLFKKADGSFSYNSYGAPAHSQGAEVCFGENEGDVNGSALANGTIVALYSSLGLTKPIYYNSADKAAFWDIIYNKAPTEKTPTDSIFVDFEETVESTGLPRFIKSSLSETGDYEILKTKVYGEDSTAIRLGSSKGHNDALKVVLPSVADAGTYVLEADIRFSPRAENTSQYLMQLRLDAAYMLVFEIRGGKLHIYDSTSTGSGNVTVDLGIYTALDDWFNLRVEYYPAGKEDTFAFVYINGTLAAVSRNYYGPRVGGDVPEPSSEVKNAYFMTLNAADVDFYVDNILIERIEKSAELPEKIYDFESSEELPHGVTVSGGSGSCTAEVKKDGENYYLETTSVSGQGHNVLFSSSPTFGSANSYVFSADLKYVSSNNTTVTQIFLGNSGSTAFAIDINYNKGKVDILSRTSKGQGAKIISGIDATKAFRLEICYFPESGRAVVSVTQEGAATITAESFAYYGESTKAAIFDSVRIYSLMSAVYTLNIDNVEAYDVMER